MKYLKFESEDGVYVVEQMIGDISAEFVELSDPNLYHSKSARQLNVLSDIRRATFKNVSKAEAMELARQFVLNFPDDFTLRNALVIDDLSISSKDRHMVYIYAEGMESSKNIEIRVLTSLDEASNWLSLPDELRKKLEGNQH